MDVSVIIPVMNEAENVRLLHEELVSALKTTRYSYELIFIDDGSTDETAKQLQSISEADPMVRLILMRKNFGQTAALQAGFDHADGKIIVTIDGDRQNNPHDIPRMLQHLTDDVDVVLGWRRRRQDALLHRRLPSKIANWLISNLIGCKIADLGCALKVMRAEIVHELELYGEMHRYLAILAISRGARCVEVETNHRPRTAGKTKYGLSRTVRVILDLVTVKYMVSWFDSPMRLFGRMGMACTGLSIASGLAVIAMKLQGIDMTGNPLLLLTALSAMASMQFFSLGLIGEVCARIYYKHRQRPHYCVRTLVNFPMTNVVAMGDTREYRAA